MNTLSTILADIEVTAEKVKNLEAELATEREHGNALVEQYRAQSGDALKMLGIAETRKERKPRTNEAVLMSMERERPTIRFLRVSIDGNPEIRLYTQNGFFLMTCMLVSG